MRQLQLLGGGVAVLLFVVSRNSQDFLPSLYANKKVFSSFHLLSIERTVNIIRSPATPTNQELYK